MIKLDKFEYQNKLNKKNKYFEGWYFKHTNGKFSFSVIPGICKDKAFIQYIDTNSSAYFEYSLSDFKYVDDTIIIENNKLSKSYIELDINRNNYNIKCRIEYSDITNIKCSILSPNIMGPFSYIPFMECNHHIASLKHNLNGYLLINNTKHSFNNSIGYIEKDYGTSFPKKWIWLQANDRVSSLFFSYATIPFLKTTFNGLICIVYINNIEYRFATYNCSKVTKIHKDNNLLLIKLKKHNYTLEIDVYIKDCFKLKSPIKGIMNDNTLESLNSNVGYRLYYKGNIIYEKRYFNGGVEYNY